MAEISDRTQHEKADVEAGQEVCFGVLGAAAAADDTDAVAWQQAGILAPGGGMDLESEQRKAGEQAATTR